MSVISFIKNFRGLHKFVPDGDKVILQTDGKPSVELDAINIFDGIEGILRTKFKIKKSNGDVPVDIFIHRCEFKDFNLELSGIESETKSAFDINIGYSVWHRNWKCQGSIKDRQLDLTGKDLGEILGSLINEISRILRV